MFTRPAEISDDTILAAVSESWPVQVDAAEYAPVGFGSHHWHVGTSTNWDWFVTVHDLAAKGQSPQEPLDEVYERLRAAFQTARDLADDGLDFVLAPDRSITGDVVLRLDERFTLACFPNVRGVAGDYGRFNSASVRGVVARHLVDLHHADVAEVQHCRLEDFVVPSRNEFNSALEHLDDVWDSGPYAQPAQELLRAHRPTVMARFARYDAGVREALTTPDCWVITHGEPHGSNVITTNRGSLLIDWDTALVAPRERDVWHLDADGATAAEIYTQAGGTSCDEKRIALYRLQWDLMEIAGYIALFHAAHEDTEDARESFRNLNHYIAPRT